METTIAVPKGRLYQGIVDTFKKCCGITLPSEGRKYFYKNFFGENINLFIAKPKSIPQLLESGLCQFGFCGMDIMEDSNVGISNIEKLHDTCQNKINIVYAVNPKIDFNNLKRPIICATEFPNIAAKYLVEQKGLSVYVLNTSGATEGYTHIGADCIIDVCETGETIEANGLQIVETLFSSSTCLFGIKNIEKPNIIKKFI